MTKLASLHMAMHAGMDAQVMGSEQLQTHEMSFLQVPA